MLRTVVENRAVLSFLLSSGAGYLLLRRFPFPSDDNVLQLIALEKPWLFDAAHWSYTAMLFSTPLIAFSSIFALLYIFAVKTQKPLVRNPLPAYPHCGSREQLFVVVGEVHHATRLGPVEHPHWLAIPDRGLFTGIAVLAPSAPARPAAACTRLPNRSFPIARPIGNGGPALSSSK